MVCCFGLLFIVLHVYSKDIVVSHPYAWTTHKYKLLKGLCQQMSVSDNCSLFSHSSPLLYE